MKNDYYLPSIIQPQYLPIVGFILQKDVFTTNLLYANDQFPTQSLRKNLPFRSGSGRKPKNPSRSLTILRQNGTISHNSENEALFYTRNTFKPKKLHKRHLKFPLPKIKSIPLTNSILREDICKQDIRIKYMDDDLNITSKFGKKIIYNLKESNNIHDAKFPLKNDFSSSPSRDKKVDNLKKSNTINTGRLRKYINEFKINNLPKRKHDRFKISNIQDIKNILPVRQAICQINSELKTIEQEDKDRKRSFYRNKFFATQLNTHSNNESSKNKSLYDPIELIENNAN